MPPTEGPVPHYKKILLGTLGSIFREKTSQDGLRRTLDGEMRSSGASHSFKYTGKRQRDRHR